MKEELQIVGSLAGIIKTAASTLGGAVAIGAAYVSIGGPVPATVGFVAAQIAEVRQDIGIVRRTVMSGQRTTISMSRAFLRNERVGLVKALESLPENQITTRLSLNRRMAEIDDLLQDMNDEDDVLRKALGAK